MLESAAYKDTQINTHIKQLTFALARAIIASANEIRAERDIDARNALDFIKEMTHTVSYSQQSAGEYKKQRKKGLDYRL